MKKVFGWIFIVVGVLNVVRGVATISIGQTWDGGLIIFTIGFFVLGIWMVASKPKEKPKF